jgi:hypothetical protein
MQTFGRWHSGKFASGTAGAAFAGRISWARPQFGRSRRAPFPNVAESRRHRNDRNQAQESWICNSSKPNLPQTFLGLLVVGLMTAKAGLISVVAVLLMAFADGNLSAGSARAEEICLAAPNAPAPQGSHWYYRTDFIKQSKCWYLRAEGQAIETPTAQQKPESIAAKRPAAAMPKTAPDQAAPEAKQLRSVQPAPAKLGDRPRQSSTQDATQAGHQGRGDTVTWPDPPTPAGANNVVRPDPQGATAESIPEEERASQTQEEPATAANSDKDAGNDAGVARQVAEPIEVAVSHSAMPAGLFLAFVIGLLIVGIIVRRIVRMTFARRRTVFRDRREPVGTTSIASECAKPKFVTHYRDLAPGWVDNDRPNDEVKEALRKLLLVLDPQAA